MRPRHVRVLAVCGVLAASVLTAGAVGRAAQDMTAGQRPGAALSAEGRTSSMPEVPVPAVRPGREAADGRIRFAPDLVVLPGGTLAPVDPAATVAGVLQVPDSVHRAGWWDGGAYVGDPFGATVVAGHVDSSRQGLGAFAALLDVRFGEQVVLEGDGHRAVYEVTSVQEVDKDALATSSLAFGQRGTHRLVLITCTGRFDPERRSYDQNLVVVAEPVGAAA